MDAQAAYHRDYGGQLPGYNRPFGSQTAVNGQPAFGGQPPIMGQPMFGAMGYNAPMDMAQPSIQSQPAPSTNTTEAKKLTEEELASEKERRRRELEESFSYDGYKVIRKELFAHSREPSVTIRKDSIMFNAACIDGLEDVVYVHIMFNETLKRLVVEGCGENEKDAIRWCIAKPDKRKSRKMSCRPFTELIYDTMGWEDDHYYKVLGYQINFQGKAMFIFDLLVPERFHERKKRKKGEEAPANEAPVNTRKGFYPDDISGTFGVSVEDHRKEAEVTEVGNCVSMAMLTGKKTEAADAASVDTESPDSTMVVMAAEPAPALNQAY